MPILRTTWLGRLTAQCPGWYFWYSEHPFPDRPWHAVPAPPRTRVKDLASRRDQVAAATPQMLRDRCRRLKGWEAPGGAGAKAG